MTLIESASAIIARARAGATTLAWDSFVAAGLAEITDDPTAITLKGRLLKDQARKTHGGASARLYLQSAKTYADAAALKPDSYPLINAATMSLFAGQPDHMTLLAQRVLTMLLAIQASTSAAQGALQIVAPTGKDDGGFNAIAPVLRMAECAVPGAIISDAASARAMLSFARDLSIEPLGELSDAAGPIEIYAISSKAQLACARHLS